MRFRLGPGPVFFYECAIAARRWQTYALRTLAAALAGIGLALVWWMELHKQPLTISRLAKTGEWFFYALVSIQLSLVLLAAPAYTAGSVCRDKMSGTLLHLLATDLSSIEVVLGKLVARLLPVLGLILTAMPVLFGAVLLGGIPPEAAVGALLVMLGVAVLGSALALTLSVWLRKTQEVLLLVYLLVIVSLLLAPVWSMLESEWGIPPRPLWVDMGNPFLMCFLPYRRPWVSCLNAQAAHLSVVLAMSTALIVLAVWRVRAVAIRQGGRPQRNKRGLRRFWPSLLPWPSLDGNPVLWREWHRRRPSLWSGSSWALYGGLAIFFSVLALGECLVSPPRYRGMPALVNACQVSIGLLLMCITSVTSLAEERLRGCLDLLLATPLSTLKILQGKWWGAYRTVILLVVLPGLIAFAAAIPVTKFRVIVGVPGIVVLAVAAAISLGFALDALMARKVRALALAAVSCVLCFSGLVALAASLSTEGSRTMIGVLLLIAQILAYGAVVTSLGLALATWMARPGRALTLAVTLFVLLTVAPVLLHPSVGFTSELSWLSSASPLLAISELTVEIRLPDAMTSGSMDPIDVYLLQKSLWLGGCLAAAFILFLFTWITFSRCLGRIEGRLPRRHDPRIRERQVSATADAFR